MFLVIATATSREQNNNHKLPFSKWISLGIDTSLLTQDIELSKMRRLAKKSIAFGAIINLFTNKKKKTPAPPKSRENMFFFKLIQ